MRTVFLCLALAIAATLATGCDATDTSLDASPVQTTADLRANPRWGGPDTPALAEVTVMSQNLYLGGDLFTLLSPECQLPALLGCVAQLYSDIVGSDFSARAESIADEIARIQPALVGLQEVSTYYVQAPGDNHTATPTQATAVTIDFLQTLLDALADRGLAYQAVAVNDNADVELPATTDGVNFFDVRYRDADVVLARVDPDVQIGATTGTAFQALLTLPVGGQPQTFVRGYQTVQATVDGYAFTFVNTHLEVGGNAAPVQEAQAAELKAAIDATAGAVVLVGDLNSNADGSSTASYGLITQSLDDVYDQRHLRAGPTCCQAADLLNLRSELDRRIDFVLYRGFDTARRAETILDEQRDRVSTARGLLWPSDHAGVAAQLIQNLRRTRHDA